MRAFLFVSFSAALVSACAPLEVMDLGGDAGRTSDASTSNGMQPPTGTGTNGTTAPPVPGSLPSSADASSYAITYGDAAALTCTPFDASAPMSDSGSYAYSVPLPGTGSPASPADGWIVFDSDLNAAGTPSAYAIRPDGTSLQQIGTGRDPVVSPDGQTMVTILGVNGGAAQLFGQSLSVGIPKQLTSMSGGADQAAFSPDGKRIAFNSGGSVFVMNADGTNVRPVVTSTAPYFGEWYQHPTFTADGQWIIVDRNNEIDAFNLSTHEQRSVVGNWTTGEAFPVVSRDGTTLAFLLNDKIIGLVAPGGSIRDPSDACPVSRMNLGTLDHPSWGPRGLLTFSHMSSTGLRRIVVMDTANPNATPVEILQDISNQTNPTWAPSTARIAWEGGI
jgi:Tol biopolymer transport system component